MDELKYYLYETSYENSQKQIDKLEKWTKKLSIKINAEEAQAIGRTRKHQPWRELTLGGTTINWNLRKPQTIMEETHRRNTKEGQSNHQRNKTIIGRRNKLHLSTKKISETSDDTPSQHMRTSSKHAQQPTRQE